MKNKKLSVDEVLKCSFAYCGVKYDYSRSGCRCDSEEYICRCTTIEDEFIESIDLIKVAEEIGRLMHQNSCGVYTINRILTALKMYEDSNWYIRVCGGYYGEEIEGVYIENKDIAFWLNQIESAKTDVDKIKIALHCEYGFLLDSLKELNTLEKVKVKIDDLIIPQREYYVKLDKSIVDKYKDYNDVAGLVVESGNKYRLIDGYHRVSAVSGEFEVYVMR